MTCDQAQAAMHPYIDGEISSSEQLLLESHLLHCASCRSEYESLREVVDTVRGSKPLYPVAPSLAETIDGLVEQQDNHRRRRAVVRAGVMAAVFAATIALFAWLPQFRSQQFTSFAAGKHRDYAQGSLALEVKSPQPAIVSSWLQEHLPFHFALPDFQPGEAKSYTLVGARLLRFGAEDVAYLAYTMDNRPISLLVSSGAPVLPMNNGKTLRSGNLDFHVSSENGLKLITWKDRGLSYALVSDVQVEGAQSCIVCHGSQPERQKFERLRHAN